MTERSRPGHAPGVHLAHAIAAPLERHEPLDFDALYESTVDFAYRVLGSMGVREFELEDALQDVFVVAHRRLASFRGDSKPSTWVAGIAVRVAHDYRRRHTRKPSEAIELDSLESAALGPDVSVMRAQGMQAVQAFVEQLSPVLSEVFVLAELEQQTAPAIAEALSIPLNTVYSRLRLARGHFEAWVRAWDGEGR